MATQFSLSPQGNILWQQKPNNPVPGVPVAMLMKGDHPLRPVIAILPQENTEQLDQEKLQAHLEAWLQGHFSSVFEPLVLLNDVHEDEAVSSISKAVYDGLGIVPREQIEASIQKLDQEKRAVLRAKKIRLGPILVFIPALNKPAAVRLRGLLWNLYHEKSLPAQVPPDGVVSQKIDSDHVDTDFYRAVGYPVYGSRAVRIDMLDRVISSIYDQAKGGEFEAKHEMAEWLGASIDDLYGILEAMGHHKIAAPAEPASVPVPLEVVTEEIKPEDIIEEEKKIENVKPALARFKLKKGKAFQKYEPKPYKPYKKNENFSKDENSDESKQHKKKKPQHKREKPEQKKQEQKKQLREPRSISLMQTKRRDEDSPFAILQQLKTKSDG